MRCGISGTSYFSPNLPVLTTTAQKLRIKEGDAILLLHPPADYTIFLGPLPKGATAAEDAANFQQIHWFVHTKKQVNTEAAATMALLQPGTTCWIFFPKGRSGIQTDLTRDKGWEALEPHNLKWIGLISFNNTWSAVGLRKATAADAQKKPTIAQPVLDYVDSVNKSVRLPQELEAAFRQYPEAASFFNSLSFTNKKEYIAWIVGAKKEETKKARISASVEKLLQQRKNPSDK